MELSELRIGNYYYWEAEGKKYPMKVTRKDFSNDNYKNFEPIPLSEEVLLKCGFEKLNSTWYGFGNLKLNISFDVEWGKNWMGIRLKHLHQLQNLYFALTNQELTINL